MFAMLCAQRVSVIGERLASSEEVRRVVGSALEVGWSGLGVSVSDGGEEIGRAIANLDALFELSAGNFGRYHGYLDDVIASVAYALEVVAQKDVASAVNAADRVREIYFQVAKEIWPRSSVSVILASPIVRAEVDRQARDSNDLCLAADEDLPHLGVNMRQRASEEGRDLVNLIMGCPVVSFLNDSKQRSGYGQQPLF
ncbi:hypothetical protein [Micromonospora sonneratiae]|uniref:Uncharacterized protein n=1 Tax=Micromonospora sonneratiae TaxID=1184706 RepID=A0ABW3YEH5_9ACTN